MPPASYTLMDSDAMTVRSPVLADAKLILAPTPSMFTSEVFIVPAVIFEALRLAIFALSMAALAILAFTIEPFWIAADLM